MAKTKEIDDLSDNEKDFEKKVKNLFDAQDFFENAILNDLIKQGSVKKLEDDDLDMLFAAGETFKEKKNHDVKQ